MSWVKSNKLKSHQPKPNSKLKIKFQPIWVGFIGLVGLIYTLTCSQVYYFLIFQGTMDYLWTIMKAICMQIIFIFF